MQLFNVTNKFARNSRLDGSFCTPRNLQDHVRHTVLARSRLKVTKYLMRNAQPNGRFSTSSNLQNHVKCIVLAWSPLKRSTSNFTGVIWTEQLFVIRWSLNCLHKNCRRLVVFQGLFSVYQVMLTLWWQSHCLGFSAENDPLFTRNFKIFQTEMFTSLRNGTIKGFQLKA